MNPSYSSSPNCVYDVFPSFSGEDIRDNFLSHFLKELDRKSIITFKDNEIKKGQSLDPELKKAIRDSRIAVVMFSTKYASSSWCLNELLEIVKYKEEFGQLVIPVFLRLDPTHVRKQTGDFGKIFKKTCKNVSKELINQWQKALTDIANIFGYHSKKWESEAKLIEKLIEDISGRLNLTPSKGFGEDFVGIEDHITKITSLLCMGSDDVRTVGIWGPSGIGKSTIARVLFSRLTHNFHFHGSIFIDRAFVSSVMQGYNRFHKHGELFYLIQTILSILSGEEDIKHEKAYGWGLRMLKHRKVLIFVDDLDYDMVAPALNDCKELLFGNGSRIVLVSKDKHLLDANAGPALRGERHLLSQSQPIANGITCIYEVGLPSEELAVEILCQSAFRRSSPPPDFEEIVVEVVRHAGSLPLGLNVLGSSLRGRGKTYWAEMLPRLQNSLDEKIGKTLRVSYDGLGSEDDKAIFRHIACLFNLEKDKDIALLLADSELNFDLGLKNLVAKSLVHLRLNIVEMHPLLQKLGREIVREQSKNPGKREFLVDPKDVCHVLENNTGTHRILGIRLNVDEIEELHIHENAFKKMSNLRFLKIFSNKYMLDKKVRLHLPDTFDHLPPKLKLLRWDGYPMKSLPSNFRPEKLVMLKMKDSKLKKLWEGSSELTCLREMNLWGSENLQEIPDLSRATSLEKLYLGYCLRWVQLPSSIRNFNKLTTSGILECRSLETPSTSINLESPKRLILTERSHLHLENLPRGMKPLIRMVTTLPASLTVLFLSDIPNMVELPFSIQNLNKLTDLIITQCKNLETLPTGINLKSLERLNLNGCSRLRTFPDISRNISSLYLEDTAIEEVPWWVEKFSKLKYLIMQRCRKLEHVNVNIYKLEHLEFVNFSHCGALTGWNGYPTGLALEAANIDTTKVSSSLPDNYVPKVDFSFTNCFHLDQEALFQHLPFEKLILSGEELPLHITHKTSGPSMAFRLPFSSPIFRFRACALVVFNSKPTFGAIGVCVKIICRFKARFGNHFESQCQEEYFSVYQTGSHLLLLNCHFPPNKEDEPQAEVNYDFVDIQFHMSSGNSKFKLEEWGIRLSEDYSSAENRHGTPNTLRQICEANEDNNVNEGCHETTKHGENCEENLRDNGKQEEECGDNSADEGYETAYIEEECGDNTDHEGYETAY